MEKVEETIAGLKELQKTPKDESKERIDLLISNVYKSMGETIDEVKSEFTLYEINDALLKVLHSYNRRFLDDQLKDENEIIVNDSQEVK